MHKKTKNSPFPPGRGVGDGGKKALLRQANPATEKASPPPMPRPPSFPMPLPAQVPGHQNAAPRPAPGKPPPGTCPAGLTSAARVQPRGCKGRSPLHEITLSSPFPGGEERSASAGCGDGGKQLLLRQANPATEKASPPADAATALFPNAAPGSSAGAPKRRPPPHTGQAPAGRLPRRLNQCRPGSTPGMQGAKPLA